MFGRLFRGKHDLPSEDFVWIDDAARRTGLPTVLAELAHERSILIVVRDTRTLESTRDSLAALRPVVAGDRFALEEVLPRLGSAGAVVLTLAATLERPTGVIPFDLAPAIHVLARSPARSADARLLASLQAWHPGPIVFHSSLDDPLLREHARGIGTTLKTMGMRGSAPLSGAPVSRALRKAQRD